MNKYFYFVVLLTSLCIFAACTEKNPTKETTSGTTVSASGGTYEFDNGVILVVPSGALDQDTYITLSLNTEEQTEVFVNNTGITEKNLLAAVMAEPDSLEFNLPVTLKMPCRNELSGIGIPFHFVFDEEAGYVKAQPTDLIYLPEENMVEVQVNSFSNHAVAEVEAALSSLSDCRSGKTEVKESTRYKAAQNGDCQVFRIEGYVIFWDCLGQPKETWIFEEASEECEPMIKIEGPAIVPKNSETDLIVKVLLAGNPLPNQEVSLTHEGTGSINQYSGWTNSSGEAPVIFTATEETGEASIGATADVMYQTEFISVNDQIVKNKTKQKFATASYNVTVKNVEAWEGTLVIEMNHSISEEHYCVTYGTGTRHKSFYCKSTIDFDFVLDEYAVSGNGTGIINDVNVETLTEETEDLSVFCGEASVVTKDYPVDISGYRPYSAQDSLRFYFKPEIEFGNIFSPDGTIGGTYDCRECWRGEDCETKTWHINLPPCYIGDPSYSQILYWIIWRISDRFPYQEGTYSGSRVYELNWCDPVAYTYSLTIRKK